MPCIRSDTSPWQATHHLMQVHLCLLRDSLLGSYNADVCTQAPKALFMPLTPWQAKKRNKPKGAPAWSTKQPSFWHRRSRR